VERVVVEDAGALASRAAAEIAGIVAETIAARGRCTLCLAGGSTPAGAYAALAARFAATVDWRQVHFFWNDERCVPPESPDSNYRMADRALLSKLPVRPERVHRMLGERTPWAGARDYEVRLARAFDGPPRFDLLLLGLGDDAHIASLFPGHPALVEQAHTVLAVEVNAPIRDRLTLTAPVLNAAARILFLVSGEKKAAAVHSVLAGPRDPQAYPAQLISHATWLLDRAAAAAL
jgi:6-phosphogluconolactonase